MAVKSPKQKSYSLEEVIAVAKAVKSSTDEATDVSNRDAIKKVSDDLEVITKIAKDTGFWLGLIMLALGMSGTGIYAAFTGFTTEKFWGGTLSQGTAWYFLGTNSETPQMQALGQFPITQAFKVERSGASNIICIGLDFI